MNGETTPPPRRQGPSHRRLLAGLLAIQALALWATLRLVGRAQVQQAEAAAREQLESMRETLQMLLDRQGAMIADVVSALGKDFAIKQAVSTGDPRTIASVAANLRARSGAEWFWVLDRKGRAFAGGPAGRPAAPESRIARKALEGRAVQGIESFSGRPYLVASAPLEGPDVLGAIAAAFPIDDRQAASLRRIARFDVTFSAKGEIRATSLPPSDWGSRREFLARYPALPPIETAGDGRRLMRLAVPLRGGVLAFVHLPMDDVLAPLRRLRTRLLLIGAAAFLLSALLGAALMRCFAEVNRRLISELEDSNAKLAELNEFKSKFFAAVSHDIRNPISAISGYAEMISAESPRAAKMASTIQKAAETLSFLVADLMDFASIESGKFHVQPQPTDLREVAREVIERMEPLAKRKSILLSFKEPDGPLTASADARRIAQALQNLCSNALHYTPEGGRVSVSLERSGARALLRVVDTGVGIAAADLPRVFERFFQAPNGGPLRSGGFGLGLAIVDEIVRAHGGLIDVQSEPGKGSTFTLSLPADLGLSAKAA